MTTDRLLTGVVLLGGLFFLVPGIWALVDPRGFYDQFAPWEPYNEHFIHDIGAFQVGIGAALLAAAFLDDAKLVALIGGAIGAAVHFLSHIIDHGSGGLDSDLPVFGAVAALLAAAAVTRWAGIRQAGVPAREAR